MSSTPYLKLAFSGYEDSTTLQDNKLTYAIGAVGSTLADALLQIPGTSGISGTVVSAGSPDTVPDTTKGQHNSFSNPASGIETAVNNSPSLVGVPLNMQFRAIANLAFWQNTQASGDPYNGKINIWNSTSAPYTLWGSFESGSSISEISTIIVERLDTGPPIISVYRNSDSTKIRDIGWSGNTAPSSSLPLSFVIELESTTANLDYLPLYITDNCFPGDTLVEKMVEVEIDDENI